MKRVKTFAWYGGKFRMLNWILDNLFPKKRIFVDLFGGSAAVILNRQLANPAKIAVYNDLNGDVVKFFRILRDNSDCLIEKLKLTPYAKEEHMLCLELEGCDDIEWARRYFVLARQSMFFGGAMNTAPRWSVSRAWPRAGAFFKHVDSLDHVVSVLRMLEVHCNNGISLIDRFSDTEDALLYADPPYPSCARTEGGREYKHETSDQLHIDIHAASSKSKSLIAISTAQNEMYDDLYGNWRKESRELKNASSLSVGGNKNLHECLYMNYDELGNKIA